VKNRRIVLRGGCACARSRMDLVCLAARLGLSRRGGGSAWGRGRRYRLGGRRRRTWRRRQRWGWRRWRRGRWCWGRRQRRGCCWCHCRCGYRRGRRCDRRQRCYGGLRLGDRRRRVWRRSLVEEENEGDCARRKGSSTEAPERAPVAALPDLDCRHGVWINDSPAWRQRQQGGHGRFLRSGARRI
jgi:hypothetical protein